MLLANGWSELAEISFAPDLSGNDPSSGSSRFLGRCSEMRCCEKQKQRDFLYSTTWSVSMQYQAQISDHSTLGNCFRRCRRSYKCHLWRHLAAHIRRRMSAGIPGIYPRRDKTGDFASFFTNSTRGNLISSPFSCPFPYLIQSTLVIADTVGTSC